VPDPDKVAVITQTTLSVDETARVMEALRSRFPNLRTPHDGDICFATTNRQQAVKQLARKARLILVLGSQNSSNSRRLVEVARASGAEAFLVSSLVSLRKVPLADAAAIGLTAGASTPEDFIRKVLDTLGELGFDDVEEMVAAEEDMHLPLPRELRTWAQSRGARETGG